MADIELYDIPTVTPLPLTVAQVDVLRDMMNHEGWKVLMDIAWEDAKQSLKIALEPLQGAPAQRDQCATTVKTIAWFLTLKQRLQQAVDAEQPIPADEIETLHPPELQDGAQSVIDAFLSDLRKMA